MVLGRSLITHGVSERLFTKFIQADRHLHKIRDGEFNLVIVEDLLLLNPIIQNKHRDTKIIFDAREYLPREFESSFKFNFFDKPRNILSLKKGIPRVDAFYTVCDALANEYEVDFKVRPTVVRSTPFLSNNHSRAMVDIPIKMVHHGNANVDRGIKAMIEVAKRLGSKFTLDLYLVGDEKNIRCLRNVAKDYSNIRFQDPVEFRAINSMLVSYDIGFYLLQPTSFNNRYALPNKFFEFIQAGLAVIVGPSPEMASLVTKYSCGTVAADFTIDSMVRLLERLSYEDIAHYKAAARLAAQELCWERESMKLSSLVKDVLTTGVSF